jgi:hypothetical protein
LFRAAQQIFNSVRNLNYGTPPVIALAEVLSVSQIVSEFFCRFKNFVALHLRRESEGRANPFIRKDKLRLVAEFKTVGNLDFFPCRFQRLEALNNFFEPRRG